MFVTGSDGNVYFEPTDGEKTGSLYRTKFVEWNDTEFDDDGETCREPGILYDTGSNAYWFPHMWSLVGGSFDEDNLEGTIWVYNLNEASKSLIENDAQYVATYVTSSL